MDIELDELGIPDPREEVRDYSVSWVEDYCYSVGVWRCNRCGQVWVDKGLSDRGLGAYKEEEDRKTAEFISGGGFNGA
jgi:Zn-finger nucleic acid-binding protein